MSAIISMCFILLRKSFLNTTGISSASSYLPIFDASPLTRTSRLLLTSVILDVVYGAIQSKEVFILQNFIRKWWHRGTGPNLLLSVF